MKNLKILLLAFMAIFTLTMCGGDDKNDVTPEEKPTLPVTTTRTVQIGWERGQQTYTLSDLKSDISNIENTSSWIRVNPLSYGSGSPNVQLDYEENDGDERSCVITFTDTNNNKVLLTVTQVKKGDVPVNPDPNTNPNTDPDYGVDDTHDVVTDQPANSR